MLYSITALRRTWIARNATRRAEAEKQRDHERSLLAGAVDPPRTSAQQQAAAERQRDALKRMREANMQLRRS